MPKSKQSADIHRRLDAFQPVAHIAAETGLSLSQIHRHKRGACSCGPGSPAAGPVAAPETAEIIDPWLPTLGAPIGNMIRWSYVVGQDVAGIADGFDMTIADVEAEITPDTRRELERRKEKALETVARRNPGRWLQLDEQRRKVEREEREAAADRIDPDRLAAFLGEIIAYQSRRLISDDFLIWLDWLRELVEYRYPVLLPVLAQARAG